MMTYAALACVLLLPAHPPELHRECVCERIKFENGWCNHCRTGYIAGLKTGSYLLVEDLDTHGHEVEVATLVCAECRKAAARNGICSSCRWGIHDGRIYGSRMTYYLAKGTPQDLTKLECATCKSAAGGAGWCDACSRGWIGHFAYTDKDTFEAGAGEYRLLKLAIETAPRCETCASARYYGSICPKCRITYKDGQPVPNTPAGQDASTSGN